MKKEILLNLFGDKSDLLSQRRENRSKNYQGYEPQSKPWTPDSGESRGVFKRLVPEGDKIYHACFALRFITLVFFTFTVFIFSVSAKENPTPKDFFVSYQFLSGGPPSSSTSETYTIQGYQIIYEREYIPTETAQGRSTKRKETTHYPLTAEQINNLWSLFLSYKFFDWSNVPSKIPPQAGNQIITVKANDKTMSHSMWEEENEEKFREFSNHFLNWVKKRMATEF